MVQKSPRNTEFRRPSRSRSVASFTIATIRLSGTFKPPSRRFSTVCQPSTARSRLRSPQVTICQWLTPRAIGFVLALFYYRQFSTFGFTDCWALSSRPTPHAPRSSGSAVDAARRAGYSTPHPAGGQHAAKCYILWIRQKFGELSFRRKLL